MTSRELSDEDKLMLPTEVAAIFRVTTKTVLAWAQQGRIVAVRTPSGRVRFRTGDVNDLFGE